MATNTKTLSLPDQVTLLVEAINCNDEGAARLLVTRAMNIIYEKSNLSYPSKEAWGDEELDSVVALIRGVKPQDSVEAILASQFVALHLQGMATMAKDYINSKGQAMMMIRLSHHALEMLQRYRGKNQTINVNYNVLNKGNAILNTMVGTGDVIKNGG
jgi:hypothetical protein